MRTKNKTKMMASQKINLTELGKPLAQKLWILTRPMKVACFYLCLSPLVFSFQHCFVFVSYDNFRLCSGVRLIILGNWIVLKGLNV